MTAAFDLDTAAEATRTPAWQMTFAGETFDMAGELTVSALFSLGEFAELMAAGSAAGDEGGLDALRAFVPLRDAVAALFSTPADWDRFVALGPTQPHLLALLSEAIQRGTGTTLGEPSAPSDSSAGGAANRRPTSLVSTG